MSCAALITETKRVEHRSATCPLGHPDAEAEEFDDLADGSILADP